MHGPGRMGSLCRSFERTFALQTFAELFPTRVQRRKFRPLRIPRTLTSLRLAEHFAFANGQPIMMPLTMADDDPRLVCWANLLPRSSVTRAAKNSNSENEKNRIVAGRERASPPVVGAACSESFVRLLPCRARQSPQQSCPRARRGIPNLAPSRLRSFTEKPHLDRTEWIFGDPQTRILHGARRVCPLWESQ